MPPTRDNAMDHVVLVLFENRSFDNLLGHLYTPDEAPAFEGVVGKDLSNPIPEWAEHGAERKLVPYTVATSMDSPNPDPGEEYQHTNTQLFNVLDPANRFKDADSMVAPFNAPAPGQVPTMDGFVADYISAFTVEMGRQPTYDEYAQIMTGFTTDQVPVLSTLARAFGVFDHWFSEVPSQTLANRSFWTAASSSNYVVNRPMVDFMHHNEVETIFERLEAHGKTWKIYVLEPDPMSFTGMIHMPRLRERFATNFVPFAQFELDVAEGALPNFSLLEPNLLAGHADYHPAFGRALLTGMDVDIDPPSSILAGEAFLARIYDALKAASSPVGSNALNTTFLVGWDEPGGTYDHVPPGPVPPPHPSTPPDKLGFTFDRSGYRVPAVIVSPWIDEGTIVTEEYRHTSLIATLRQVWDLGPPLSDRDAQARTFNHLLTRHEPRPPDSWPAVHPHPVPEYQASLVEARGAISTLGKHFCHGVLEHAHRNNTTIPQAPADPNQALSPTLALDIVHRVAGRYFPLLEGKHAAGRS